MRSLVAALILSQLSSFSLAASFDSKRTTDAAPLWILPAGAVVHKCFTAVSNVVGAPIQIQDCNSSAGQEFVPSGGALTVFGKCVSASSTSAGTPLQLATCSPSAASQKFTITHSTIVLTGTGVCADYAGQSVNGTPVEIWGCSGNANQAVTFSTSAPTPPVYQAIQLYGSRFKCLTAVLSSLSLIVEGCSADSEGQRFSFANGAIAVYGSQCVDVDAASGRLRIFNCAIGNGNQKFHFEGLTIEHDETGQCIDIPAGSLADGTPVAISPCVQPWTQQYFLGSIVPATSAIPPFEPLPIPPFNPLATLQTPYTNDPCINPEVRREWSTISNAEKQAYTDAVKCLAKLPHNPLYTTGGSAPGAVPVDPNSSIWDDFVYLHFGHGNEIHLTGKFLPFHRHYLHGLQNVMKERCGYPYPLPYWDWTKYADDTSFQAFIDDNAQYLGGWGNSNNDFIVEDGPFPDITASYPAKHKVRRRFNPLGFNLNFFPQAWQNLTLDQTITPADLTQTVQGNISDFARFQYAYEYIPGPHGQIHAKFTFDMIGVCGNYNTTNGCSNNQFTPSDPIFYLHHGNIDRIWNAWQKNDFRNYFAYVGGPNQSSQAIQATTTEPNGAGVGLLYNATLQSDQLLQSILVQHLFNTTGGPLCYVYDTLQFPAN